QQDWRDKPFQGIHERRCTMLLVLFSTLGVLAVNRLLNADELDPRTFRFLDERKRVAFYDELVLKRPSGLHCERALGYLRTQGQPVAADGVTAGVHVQHVEDGDFVGIRGDVVGRIGWE